MTCTGATVTASANASATWKNVLGVDLTTGYTLAITSSPVADDATTDGLITIAGETPGV
jgi:hypothetical protein